MNTTIDPIAAQDVHIQRNMDAIQAGDRVFGAFQLDDQTRIWMITEHDRSSTCILLPDEY